MLSWRLATFVILGLVLAGGFAWYERSRPPSRIVALVAALAALAVAGRLAFAAIPNVQATTDVVLITGFAVGGGPGFAVGALGALVSNFWLGQGPWTPWEMAGWGLVGLGGAGLAAVTRRRVGRLGLAVACAVAGLLYGALLDYSVMATAGGPQTLERYLAISSRGIPFNLAHAVGNFALALAAGPALVRIVGRYRARLEFDWRREWAAPLLLVAAVLGAGLGGAATGARAASASPAAWLSRAENADGGFGIGPGSASSPEMTGWAMLGLEAAGRNPLDLAGGPSPVAYLRSHAASVSSTGDIERTILAFEGAGVDPRRLGHGDLLSELRGRRARSGGFSGEVNLTAFGILALRSAGEPARLLSRSRRWLKRAENADGGWGIEPGIASDPDSTGAALQGLAAGGAPAAALRQGVAYLRADQNHDGGWPLGGHGPSNSQSTAWAVQGLVAAGTPPGAVASGGRTGLDYLAARRAGDGHIRYSAASDQTPVWVTGQALMAVEREALPLPRAPRARPRAAVKGNGGGNGGGGGRTSAAAPSAGAAPSPASAAATSGGGSSPAGGGAPAKRPAQGRGSNRGPSHAASASAPSGNAGAKQPSARGVPAETAAAPQQSDAGSGSTARSEDDRSAPIAAYLAAGAAVVIALAAAGWWWRRRRSSPAVGASGRP